MISLPRPLAFILATLAGLWLAFFPFLVATMGLRGDFLAFFTGAHLLWWGDLARLYERELYRAAQLAWVGPFEGAFQFVYLPAFVAYYLPVATLPVAIARVAWIAGMAGLLAVAAHVSRAWQRLTGATMGLAVLAFAGAYAAYVVGQNSALTLLLMCLVTLWMMVRPRPEMAGVAAGMLLYKPQLLMGLVLVWVLQRQRRSLAVFAAAGVLWLGLSWLLAPGPTQEYFALGQSLLRSLNNVRANSSVYAALTGWMPGEAAATAALAVSIVVLATLGWVWARYSPGALHFAMLWLSTLLSTPYVASYDLLLLLLPLSLLVPRLVTSRALQVAVATVWLGPAISFALPETSWIAWAMLGLFFVCAWEVHLEQRVKSNV